ncbi:MAG: VWA domain-containing protein, partial [Cyanobacteria bacterium P01_E01_bin.45]
PAPDVVDVMLRSWQDFAKRPSQVVVVVDSSGSMEGVKLSAVQSTLSAYIDSLGPQEEIVLVDFDESIRQPILVDSSQEGRARGYQFVTGLRADGGTRLYDATIAARDYLLQNARPEAINAVIVLTDGEDSGSQLSFDVLNQELQQTGFAGDARIAVFTVGYSDRGGGFNPRVLEDIASVSGGYYREGDPSSISRLMADLQVEF